MSKKGVSRKRPFLVAIFVIINMWSWGSVANAIQLTSNKSYTTVGGELALSGNTQNRSATATTSKLYVDGKAISLTAYNIGGNNYFKLRDVGKTFNFGIGYDNATKVITIDAPLDYEI